MHADSALPNVCLPFDLQKLFCIFTFCKVEYFDNFGAAFWDAGSCFADTGRDSNALNHPSYVASPSIFLQKRGVFFMCFFFRRKTYSFSTNFPELFFRVRTAKPINESISAHCLVYSGVNHTCSLIYCRNQVSKFARFKTVSSSTRRNERILSFH